MDATGSILPAWLTVVVLTVSLSVADAMLRRRWRRMSGATTVTFWQDYAGSVAAVLRGKMPGNVTFRTFFAPVVYFTCLGVCISATVTAGNA